MGTSGGKFCERHPDQEMMFICVSETPPRPICAKCRADKSHYKHEVRSTKNLASERFEKLRSLPGKVRRKFKLAVDQPKSTKAYEQILEKGTQVINSIFDRISKELESVRTESLNNFTTHMKTLFDTIPVKPFYTSLPTPLLQLLSDIDSTNKHVAELFSQAEYTEVCSQNETYHRMKERLNKFMLTLQSDYIIRHKLEPYQIFFEQGEFRNQFKKLVQTHVRFYYSGDRGNEEVVSAHANRLHVLMPVGNRIRLFDLHSRQWSCLTIKGEEALAESGMRSVESKDNKIFVVGGRRGLKYLKDMHRFNEDRNCLTRLMPMNVERAGHGLVIMNGLAEIYALGGENQTSYLGSCEVYKIRENKWLDIGKLNIPRKDLGACAFNEAFVYVVAGTDDEYQNSIEQYAVNGSDKSWKLLRLAEEEFVPRINCGAAQLGDSQIVIFGGYSDKKLSDSFVFKPGVGKLAKTSGGGLKQAEEFEAMSCEVLDKCLYCLQAEAVHVFDPQLQRWSLL